MSTNLDRQLDEAVSAYTHAVLRTDLPPSERRRAAQAFQVLARRFVLGSAPIQHARRAASSDDGTIRQAASRLLASIPDPRAATALLDVFREASAMKPEPALLGYLGLAAPVPEEAWTWFDSARPEERGPLARALLREPSEEARRRLEVLTTAEDPATRDALASATWCEPELPRRLLRGPRRKDPELPPWLDFDVRVEAAFQLALRGEHDGVTSLERWAQGLEEGDAGHSLVCLGWLAWPGGVPLVSRALAGRNVAALELALDAAGALRAAALVEPLLALAERPDAPMSPYGLSLPEGALAVAARIVGAEGAPSVEACRHGLARLTPTGRYLSGQPLSLVQLAAELESPHTGVMRAAGYNLRCMTGRDFGFDPALDFIANLAAIDAWQQYAATAPFVPGGWLWRGQPLPPPGPAPV